MADQLATAAAWLNTQRDANLAGAVTYSRGASTVTWTAAKGRTEFSTVDSYGVQFPGEWHDFIGQASTLILDGSVVEPLVGDTVTVNDGTYVNTYSVTRPNETEPPFRYSDTGRTTLRIHTKFISRSGV